MGQTYEEGTGTLDFELLKAELEALKTEVEDHEDRIVALEPEP